MRRRVRARCRGPHPRPARPADRSRPRPRRHRAARLYGSRPPAASSPAGASTSLGRGRGRPPGTARVRFAKCGRRIALDPYGPGSTCCFLPSAIYLTGSPSGGLPPTGETDTVRSRALWVGAAEAAPETTSPAEQAGAHGAGLTRRQGRSRCRAACRRAVRPSAVLRRGRPSAGGHCLTAPRPGLDHAPGRPDLDSPDRPGRGCRDRRSRSAGTDGGCSASPWKTCRQSASRAAGRTRSKSRRGRGCCLASPCPA